MSFRHLLRRALPPALLLCGMAAGIALHAEEPAKQPPKPAQSLALETYGYRPSANTMALRAGYTNATVSFIDPDHLLLTYSARKLMLRDPEQREGDDDNTVRAVIIHLPDGKAIRETEWRMHDRSPYLWPLANGHYLLRIRNNLYSLDPLGTFNREHLGQRLLIESSGRIALVETSPTRDVLLVETLPASKIGDDPADRPTQTVSASFFHVGTNAERAVVLVNRGRLTANDLFSFPFTALGVLQSVPEDRAHWGFDFHPYTGKNMELAGFTTTCRPRAYFISDAEFFAFGCRGGTDRRLMGGFNLMAEAKWVFTTDDSPLWLWIETAPAVGRFAMRNTLTNSQVGDEDDIRFGADLRGQEVRVFSDREGNELLRVTASPVQKPGGNFALSPDGLRLAILHDSQIEIYTLPPVDAADKKLHERELQALKPLEHAAETDIAVSLSNKSDGTANTPAKH